MNFYHSSIGEVEIIDFKKHFSGDSNFCYQTDIWRKKISEVLLHRRIAVLITYPDEYSEAGFLMLQKLDQFVIARSGILWCLLDTKPTI